MIQERHWLVFGQDLRRLLYARGALHCGKAAFALTGSPVAGGALGKGSNARTTQCGLPGAALRPGGPTRQIVGRTLSQFGAYHK